MKAVGGFLIILGVGAMCLHFANSAPGLLKWVHNWGDTIAWVIMIT